MPHSHHSHSGQFCKHASGLLEDVVLEAIRKGFVVYGLTEHVPRYRELDLYPEENGLPLEKLSEQFDDFVDEAHRLQSAYAPQIALLIGLETEFITVPDLDHLEALLKRHSARLDYVVGSIHHVNGLPIDFDFPTFQKALASAGVGDDGMNEFLKAYFDAQYDLMRRFHPEVIGHFDLCRLYNPTLRFIDSTNVWQLIERNVNYAIGYGALFEVNAAALKKGWETPYPGLDILKLVSGRQGRFALSDDSHGPHSVGSNYSRAAEYLRGAGVSELWYLQKCDTSNAAGRNIRPVRLPGNWWEDEFWAKSTSG